MSDTSHLAQRNCVPCRGGVAPLAGAELLRLQEELGGGWSVLHGHHLGKTFTFPDFAEALAYVNRVGVMAEEQGHHPDITLTWGKVRIEVWTHTIDGLAESDFVFAAKAEALYRPRA
jgi:4a-hydroxytetrahydrobiopterin dehydratase